MAVRPLRFGAFFIALLFLLLAPFNAHAELDAPRFSHHSGFYTQPFELTLAHPDDGVNIYYTLDGSEPDPNNLDGRTYRYKNQYQQPPFEAGQPVDIAQDFLHHEERSWRYENPISIADRSFEPDRIAAIATTDAQLPDYFPQPEPSDHWLNKYIDDANQLIVQINRGVGNLNRLLNKIVRNYKRWRTDESQPTAQIAFVRQVPNIPYWEYSGRNNYKGTPVRAITVKEVDGELVSSSIATHTYFIGEREQFSLPIILVTAPEKELYSYDQGIFVAGKGYDDWLAEGVDKRLHSRFIPHEWNNGDTPKGHIELPDTQESADVHLKTHGGTSRSYTSKSIRIYPNKNNPALEIFNANNPVRHNRFILRNAGNDWEQGLFIDGVFQQLLEGLHFSTQRYRPYTVFVNGEYHGILNARDRLDSRFLEVMFGLPSRSVDLIKTGLIPSDDYGLDRANVAQHGSLDDWTALTQNDHPQEIARAIDMESLQDYYASQMYLGNDDWPENNYRVWRYNDQPDKTVPLTDGQWRWLMYDIDAVGGAKLDPTYDSLQRAQEKNDSEHYKIFHQLMSEPSYRTEFITRFADLLNTTFDPERVGSFIRAGEYALETEMPRHIRRWSTPRNKGYWHAHVEQALDFAQKRPALQRQQLQEHYGLGDLYTLDIKVLVADDQKQTIPNNNAAIIQLNSLSLGANDDELITPAAASNPAAQIEKYLALPWSGQYFAGMPIHLSITPREGYQFSHWEGPGITEKAATLEEIELKPERDTTVIAVLKPQL